MVTDLVGSSPLRLSFAISYPKKALRTTSPVIEETIGRIVVTLVNFSSATSFIIGMRLMSLL